MMVDRFVFLILHCVICKTPFATTIATATIATPYSSTKNWDVTPGPPAHQLAYSLALLLFACSALLALLAH